MLAKVDRIDKVLKEESNSGDPKVIKRLNELLVEGKYAFGFCHALKKGESANSFLKCDRM